MYCDSFLTAHFEVPGEMFSLAMEAKQRGMGVVGSTQNILDFIKERLQEALDRKIDDHLQFVLGTESGMVTSIVSAVKGLLSGSGGAHGGPRVSVEIVFPVSSESVTRMPSSSSREAGDDFSKLSVIPGVASGEGCSIHGGCASCPYMKMNSLGSLLKVCHSLPHDKDNLSAYEAGRFSLQTPNGNLIADVGCYKEVAREACSADTPKWQCSINFNFQLENWNKNCPTGLENEPLSFPSRANKIPIVWEKKSMWNVHKLV
ncbi:quinolinate synthase [Striga asiatica]|uniref:quinolinate synthase n=1 Tax=Striga asiatica TaxID=4170 RepID=A0A5A7RHT4_STRAF|nr:quinolinate synthase [Striga asiatica]